MDDLRAKGAGSRPSRQNSWSYTRTPRPRTSWDLATGRPNHLRATGSSSERDESRRPCFRWVGVQRLARPGAGPALLVQAREQRAEAHREDMVLAVLDQRCARVAEHLLQGMAGCQPGRAEHLQRLV